MALMSFGHQQVTGNINSFNNAISNTVNIIGLDAEQHQIMQWLSPLEPQRRHQGVRTERLDSVGNWVLETREFRKWRDAPDGCVERVLFCSGNPGVGKTYISSLAIDSLCDQAWGKDVAVVGLYCDFLAQQEQSAANILGTILKQLISRRGVPEHIRRAFQKARGEFGGRGLLLPHMIEILKKTITPLPRVFICIDALDECTPKHRRDLLESLREITRVSPITRVFLTGRPHIDGEIRKWFTEAVRIPVTPAYADIRNYLEMRLEGDTDPNAMDDELRADIMGIVPEKISESFLLVSLNMDAVLGEITLHQRRRKLDEMTKGGGLGDAYAATISRIKALQGGRSKLGMDVLMWVSHAERPLHVDELCHALGVEEGSTDLNIRNIPAIETLLECSLGLITVEKSSSTVRLVHYTLQEYLSNNPHLFLKPHSTIAEVCLTYLNSRHVRSFSPTLNSVPPTAPFAEYASCYWGQHAKQEASENVKRLALKLLDGYDKHISSKILLLRGVHPWQQPLDREGTPGGFTGLHGAAYLGWVEIAVALLETNKWDVCAADLRGNTALSWAARRGNQGIIKVLLDRSDVNPNKLRAWGKSPLWLAAGGGHEGVVKILLERSDIIPEELGEWGQTPLWRAAMNGHEGVIRILLERSDVNPDKADNWGRTPLHVAAMNEHEQAVKALLERGDVNPDITDPKYGRTPLSQAAEGGHAGVVRALLKRHDVNPDKADKWGRTPLWLAAENGHEEVVKILLERGDVNPDAVDTEYGRTPLLQAAENGYEGIVMAFLGRNGVTPDMSDNIYG